MEVGFKSDTGRMRSNNEDACFVLLPDKVYVIADGVGGGNAGEIASRTAVSQIANYIVEKPMEKHLDKYDIADYFQDCLDKVNNEIYTQAKKHVENHGMATTIVVVAIRDNKAYIANVGDSRAYLYRDGLLTQLTEDHTYVNSLVKAGVMSPEEAENDDRHNVITKALGADKEVEPDFFMVEIMAGDRILMCTDGLYDELSGEKISEIMDRNLTMSDTSRAMVDEANASGGHDNITVINLRVTEEDIDE